jgi:hypothetical protein
MLLLHTRTEFLPPNNPPCPCNALVLRSTLMAWILTAHAYAQAQLKPRRPFTLTGVLEVAPACNAQVGFEGRVCGTAAV